MKKSYIPITDDILRHKFKNPQDSEYQEETFSTVIHCGTYTQEFKILIMPIKLNTNSKWLQVFSGIEIVLFMLSCCDYDIFIEKNPKKSRFNASIQQLKTLLDSKYLNTTGMIVFLNKQDILEEKIYNGIYIDIEDFPSYKFYVLSKSDDITEDDDTIAYKDYIKLRSFIRDKVMVSTLTYSTNITFF